jgi:dihydroorotase
MPYIISQATLIQKENSLHNSKVDILIEKGIIKKIAKKIVESDATEIKGDNLHVSSGWIDMRAGLTDPGYEHKDTINNLLDTAAFGGFTSILTLPNTKPSISDKSSISYLINSSKNHLVNIMPTGVIEDPSSKNNLAEMFDMHESGAIAFTNGDEEVSNGLLKKALLYTKPFNGTIISHPSDKSLEHGGVVHESSVMVNTGLKMSPSISEYISLNEQVEVAKYCNAKIHFSCISTAESVEIIRQAKDSGQQVTCDVSILNLCFTDEELLEFDENFKVYPPLRSESDRIALVQGIIDGTIDAISSNHSPQNIESKAVEFDYAEAGVLCQQFVFSWYTKYLSEDIPIDIFISCLTERPSSVLNQSLDTVEEGLEANLTIFDFNKIWQLNQSNNTSKSTNTHEWEKEQKGKVVGVFSNNCVKLY